MDSNCTLEGSDFGRERERERDRYPPREQTRPDRGYRDRERERNDHYDRREANYPPGIDLIDSDQIEIVRIDRIGAMTADLKDTMIAVAMMSTVAMTEAIELKVLTDQPLAILAILATLDTLDTLACLQEL